MKVLPALGVATLVVLFAMPPAAASDACASQPPCQRIDQAPGLVFYLYLHDASAGTKCVNPGCGWYGHKVPILWQENGSCAGLQLISDTTPCFADNPVLV